MLLALGLVRLALPVFNDLSGKNLSLHLFTDPWLLPELLVFGLLVGALAGFYPAFFLSSFKPVSVLKGKIGAGKKNIGLRGGLVVFQFFISITLIVSTTVVYEQLQYIQHKKLGYDRDHVLVLQQTYKLGKATRMPSAGKSSKTRGIVSLSKSNYLPAGPTDANNFLVYPGGHADQLVTSLRYEVDEQYIPTLGMEMAAGRNFDPAFPTDSTAVILNETALRTFGWQDDPLSHILIHPDDNGNKAIYKVIGVVRDFHFKSLHERISPLLMTLGGNAGTTWIAKVNTKNIPGLLALDQKGMDILSFRDAPLSTLSSIKVLTKPTWRRKRPGTILAIFAGLTIFVACLGLFGLATFTAEQRTKEIGIRKVLGASVSGTSSRCYRRIS